jgi:RND family efflux transporter MFP subunit
MSGKSALACSGVGRFRQEKLEIGVFMEVVLQSQRAARNKARRWIWIVAALLLALVAAWFWRGGVPESGGKGGGAVAVTSALVTAQDVAIRLTANGTVSAIQAVELRPQISATIQAVHIKEGQFVRKGERLFTLDARSEEANLGKAEAQVAKDRADLRNAERNLERQRELFDQKFIAQSALDTAQTEVDALRAQLAVDLAAVEASRVTRAYSVISAPIDGRTGAINVYPGNLVQPAGNPLLSITQLDPINVSFTLPERELAALQQARARGDVPVNAQVDAPGEAPQRGRLVFIDNAVDTASGTIRLKAEFANREQRLWPGMFVTVNLASRTLRQALTVPAQAVQTGPERKFLYAIGDDGKVSAMPVKVVAIQDGLAVVDGAVAGTRVVVEGAQSLRPGSRVVEATAAAAGGAKTTKRDKAS